MAFTSVVGIAFQTATGSVTPGVFGHWLAAAPIVALGAPLGVFAVGLLGREVTLVVVSVLCLGQFAWTCQNEWERLGWSGFALSCGAVLLAVAALQALYTFGRRWGHPVVK
jgi:hypothetical protein